MAEEITDYQKNRTTYNWAKAIGAEAAHKRTANFSTSEFGPSLDQLSFQHRLEVSKSPENPIVKAGLIQGFDNVLFPPVPRPRP